MTDKPLNILIVEDEVLIATSLENLLISEGYLSAGRAINYPQAIAILEKGETDIAIIDVKISGEQDGIAIAEAIQNNYNIPFIFLTSYTDKATIASLMKSHPRAYLSKPIHTVELLANLNIIHQDIEQSYIRNFKFRIGTTTYTINLEELLYVKAQHVYVEMHTLHQKLVVRASLKHILEVVPSSYLKQINRSTALNPNYIQRIQGNSVYVYNTVFKLTRSFRASFE